MDSKIKCIDRFLQNGYTLFYVLKVMEEFNVRKLVFSSSSCVYGNPEYLPIDENHPTGAGITNPYGRTKYFTEEIIKDLCRADKVEYHPLLIYKHHLMFCIL